MNTIQQYRIGVDVGGTNTDAVLLSLNPSKVVASHKAPTTPDVTTGITAAIHAVISRSNIPVEHISCVIVGTTHFVNAVVQRSPNLQKVAVVRLSGGKTFGAGTPPHIDFPEDLRRLIEAKAFFCQGGFQIDGSEISSVDENEIAAVAEELVALDVRNVVVSGIYAPVNDKQEKHVATLLHKYMDKAITATSKGKRRTRVTMSHTVSSLGFLARENAAILNASLRTLAERTIRGFQRAMYEIFHNSACRLYLTQNDGSVLDANSAIEFPIRTFNSGPTNSIRGGAFLWDAAQHEENGSAFELGTVVKSDENDEKTMKTLLVLDIGGTTTDCGLLINGLPRMSSVASIVGGVKTNFALPAVESVGLGGGSIVRDRVNVTVGPDSVGHEITTKSRCFGGSIVTATDVAVAAANLGISPKEPVVGVGKAEMVTDLRLETIKSAKVEIHQIIEDLIDRSKISKDDVDVLIVGGGALIVDTNKQLKGVRKCKTVKGGEVSNAVGAAISKVEGTADKVMDLTNARISEATNVVTQLAREAALWNGALESTIEVVEITVLPVQYMDARARIIVKALGELDIVTASTTANDNLTLDPAEEDYLELKFRSDESAFEENKTDRVPDVQSYQPKIRNKEWIISTTDLDFIAIGCKILGCGGGGDPYIEYLKIKAILKKNPDCIRVIDPKDLPDTASAGWTGNMGSPEVSMERMEGNECYQAQKELLRYLAIDNVDAMVALEIGGGNGLVAMDVGSQFQVPVVDADYMGRAYPTLWQTTANVYDTSGRGTNLLPAVIASGDGSFMIMTGSKTDKLIDRALRSACADMGSRAGQATKPQLGADVKCQAVLNTVSLAWRIGRAVRMEKELSQVVQRIIDEAGGNTSAKIIADGKVVAVERTLKAGHTFGTLVIEKTVNKVSTTTFKIPFKNENALVEKNVVGKQPEILVSVPDLIAVLDAETGHGLGVAEYKYGLKVVVIAITASPRWTDTARGLEVGGPGSMGFDEVAYKPIGVYHEPRSVIEEFVS